MKSARTYAWCTIAWLAVSPSLFGMGDSIPPHHGGAAAVTPRVLVLHDGAPGGQASVVTSRHLANLLGHFDCTRTLQSASACDPDTIERYDAVFLCDIPDPSLSEALIAAVARRTRPTCWIRGGIGRLLAHESGARWGFAWAGPATNAVFDRVRYNSTTLPKMAPGLDRIEVHSPDNVQILAVALGDGTELPFLIRQGAFWYMAGPAFSGQCNASHGLVLADVLHDVLGQPHPPGLRALVRLEDVSAHSNPDYLRQAGDCLARRDIPFQIAVIPFFRDPEKGVELALTDRPAVCDAIRHMVARGGSVVLHGITHQRTGVSGIDFEFWDPAHNRPDTAAAEELFQHRLHDGLAECFRARIYPVAWETPHYAAGAELYRTIARAFSHVYERRMVSQSPADVEAYPYEVTDVLGQHVLPENLGYISLDKPDASAIALAAARLRAVRDPIASFFFHPFMPAAHLETVVDNLREQGYTFVSATSFGCRLTAGDFAVCTGPATLEWTSRQPYLQTIVQARDGSRTDRNTRQERGILRLSNPPPGGLIALRGIPLDTHAPMAGPPSAATIPAGPAASYDTAVLVVPPPPLSGDADLERHSFQTLLETLSVPYETMTPASLPGTNVHGRVLWVIPRAAAQALPPSARDWILRRTASGETIVLSGRSPLAEALGFWFDGERTSVRRVVDNLFPAADIAWTDALPVEVFRAPPDAIPLIQCAQSGHPLAVLSTYGDGRALFLGTDLDPVTGAGYARYPHLPHHLRRFLGIAPLVHTVTPEYYFDPGFRSDVSIEDVVREWERDRIRAVYAAAWHFHPAWSYDYSRLIRLCHARGIAVYAWLELPMVSDRFWTEHPEWRDRTATGRDASVGWRRMMNLADPECRGAVFGFVEQLLRAHAWDGVNIAEFCFDTAAGLRDADTYVPMNSDVRQAFQAQAGFDPAELFDPASNRHWQADPSARQQWGQFRSRLLRDSLHELLGRIERVRRDRPLDIICTTLDSILSPEVTDLTGTDSRDVVALMDSHDFTLQVEDPASTWGEAPQRYAALGQAYRCLVSDPRRLMFDINVVTNRLPRHAPTLLPQGMELAVAVRAAAMAGNGRVGLYSEASLLPEDRRLLAELGDAATRAAITPEAMSIESDGHAVLHLDAPPVVRMLQAAGPASRLEIAGVPVSSRHPGRLRIPAGRHLISVRPMSAAADIPCLAECGGTLLSIAPEADHLRFRYASPRTTWAWSAAPITAVTVDGTPLPASRILRGDSSYTLIPLPAGDHAVRISSTAGFAGLLARTSRFVFKNIMRFGMLGIGTLGAVYLVGHCHKLWRKAVPEPAARVRTRIKPAEDI